MIQPRPVCCGGNNANVKRRHVNKIVSCARPERPSKRGWSPACLPRSRPRRMPRRLLRAASTAPRSLRSFGGDETAITLAASRQHQDASAIAKRRAGNMVRIRCCPASGAADRYVDGAPRRTTYPPGWLSGRRGLKASTSSTSLRCASLTRSTGSRAGHQGQGGTSTQEGLGGDVERVVGGLDAITFDANLRFSARSRWKSSAAESGAIKEAALANLPGHLAAQKGAGFAQDADAGRATENLISSEPSGRWIVGFGRPLTSAA